MPRLVLSSAVSDTNTQDDETCQGWCYLRQCLTQTHRTMRLAKAGAIFGSLTQTHRTMRLAKAGAIFGSLRCRIWNEHSIKLTPKLLSCLMMSSLLYGYTQLGYQISKVEQFYLWCLCHMLHVVWHPYSSTLQH